MRYIGADRGDGEEVGSVHNGLAEGTVVGVIVLRAVTQNHVGAEGSDRPNQPFAELFRVPEPAVPLGSDLMFGTDDGGCRRGFELAPFDELRPVSLVVPGFSVRGRDHPHDVPQGPVQCRQATGRIFGIVRMRSQNEKSQRSFRFAHDGHSELSLHTERSRSVTSRQAISDSVDSLNGIRAQ